MATGYYMGQGIMLERGETYELKKEELIQMLDMYVDHLKNSQAECDELKMEMLRMKYPNEPLLQKGTIQ